MVQTNRLLSNMAHEIRYVQNNVTEEYFLIRPLHTRSILTLFNPLINMDLFITFTTCGGQSWWH